MCPCPHGHIARNNGLDHKTIGFSRFVELNEKATSAYI